MFDLSDEGLTFFMLAGGSMLKFAWLSRVAKSQLVKRPVGRVTGLRLYPLKSAKGVGVEKLIFDFEGAHYDDFWDRHWMVTTSEHVFVTARQEPKIVLIETQLHSDHLRLNADGMKSLELPWDIRKEDTTRVSTKVHGQPAVGIDCGEEASMWISKYLGKPGHRVIYSPKWLEKRYINNGASKWHKKAEDKDKVAFQDCTPCTLLNESSMVDLTSKIPSVTPAHFRANILMDGSPAYDEDTFLELHIGTAILKQLKATDRCIFTTIDPETGIKDPKEEPLHTMRKFRMLPNFATPCFCISLLITKPGVVRVGDTINAVRGAVTLE